MEALFEIMARESDILSHVTEEEIRRVDATATRSAESDDNEEEWNSPQSSVHRDVEQKLQTLRNEAYETTNLLTTLRQDFLSASSTGPGGSGTHTVQRKSDRDAEKMYKKAVRRAAVAIERAKEAGALTDADEKILSRLKEGREVDSSDLGKEWILENRGLDGMSSRQMELMRRDLLPEGTRVYDSTLNRGLPRGAIREVKEGYERVIIPAPILDRTKLPKRIVLDEVMDGEERKAFEGTHSLNPMQSTVFDAAYRSRENLLICAPTGAGVSNFCRIQRPVF